MSYLKEAYPSPSYEEDRVRRADILPSVIRRFFMITNGIQAPNNRQIDSRKPVTNYLRRYMFANSIGLGTGPVGRNVNFRQRHDIFFNNTGLIPTYNFITVIDGSGMINTTFRYGFGAPITSEQTLLSFAQALSLHNATINLARIFNANPTAINLTNFNNFLNSLGANNFTPPGWTFQGDPFFNRICNSLNTYQMSVRANPVGGVGIPLTNATLAQTTNYTNAVFNATNGGAVRGGNGVILNGQLLPVGTPQALRRLNDTIFMRTAFLNGDLGRPITGQISINSAFDILRAALP